ncbi:MAG TPA: BatD family protein [Polyangia bacterium]|nr:BatD family protein [Polyangia bacterium]
MRNRSRSTSIARVGRFLPPAISLSIFVALAAWPAGAVAASLTAALDREAVAPGEPFFFEVTATVADETVENYRPPDFHGLQVLSAPSGPNRSTNMQIAGGQTSVQNTFSWSYQLALPPTAKGPLTIGAAHLRIGGRDVASNALQLRIGSAGAQPRPARGPGPGNLFQQFFGGGPSRSPIDDDPAGAVSSTPSAAFIRVVPDKTHAFVGEQITVAWYLYLSQDQNKYETLSEPHTDGFWSEEIPSTNPQGRLAFTPEVQGGHSYNVALLFKRALFPLQPGKLTVTSMEAQVAQVDFFGSPVRARRIKTDPLVIEAQPLPREGQPPHFEAGNVGRYEIAASVDRSTVAVGDAVTLKIAVKGTGNVRNVRPPALPPLGGWKSYEPKTDVAVDGGEVISGTKTVEWLLRPERAGRTAVPAFVMQTFDPATKRYREVRSKPFELIVSGEAGSSAPAVGGLSAPAGVENVVSATIRPIRVRSRPSGELGWAFLHGAGLPTTVVAPPLALALLSLFGRVRDRLGRDSRRTRRRRARTMARRRLRAAESHRAVGRAGAFYVEIDRVLREALAERLGTQVGGLRLDELAALLAARGLPADDAAGVIRALETGDEARFAPGGEKADPAVLSAALARAGELLDAIERAPLGGGQGAT